MRFVGLLLYAFILSLLLSLVIFLLTTPTPQGNSELPVCVYVVPLRTHACMGIKARNEGQNWSRQSSANYTLWHCSTELGLHMYHNTL